MNLAAVGVLRTADGLAIHPDRDQWRHEAAFAAGRGRAVTVTSAAATITAVLSRGGRPISHAPVTASNAGASAPVITGQIVLLDGGPATSRAAPHRWYSPATTPAGTSAAQPAIAVKERIPATTAPAASASTAGTG